MDDQSNQATSLDFSRFANLADLAFSHVLGTPRLTVEKTLEVFLNRRAYGYDSTRDKMVDAMRLLAVFPRSPLGITMLIEGLIEEYNQEYTFDVSEVLADMLPSMSPEKVFLTHLRSSHSSECECKYCDAARFYFPSMSRQNSSGGT